MEMTRRVMIYTLEVICHGNRSECARRLDMNYVQFKKMYNHVMEGKESFTMPEALMKLYAGEDLDFNAALRYGKEEKEKAAKGKIETTCSELTRIAKSILEYGRLKAQDTAVILSAAGTLLKAIENCYCGHSCDRSRYADQIDNCPISRLIDYIEWLQEELSEDQMSEDN